MPATPFSFGCILHPFLAYFVIQGLFSLAMDGCSFAWILLAVIPIRIVAGILDDHHKARAVERDARLDVLQRENEPNGRVTLTGTIRKLS